MMCRRLLISSLRFVRQHPIIKQTPCFVSENSLSGLTSSEVSEDRMICPRYDSNPNFKPLLTLTNSFGLDKGLLIEALDSNSNVLNISPDQIETISKQLVQFGLHSHQIANCIVHYPEIFSSSPKQLEESLIIWSGLEFSQNLLNAIFNHHPNLINKMDHNCTKRIRFLLPYLENNKNVGKAILFSPNVLFEEWSSLVAKLKYFHSIHVMSEKIASSGGLKLSLNQIKTRFEFLRRAGLYKDIQPKKRLVDRRNPKIENILSTSEENFVKNIARLSMIEFETFVELYELELDADDSVEEDDGEYDSE